MTVRERRAAIRAIRSHLPAGKLTNEQLAQEYQDRNVLKIFQKTGIAVRGVAAANECASDLGVAAGQKLFESGVCRPEDIDFLIFCTQTPDYFLPTTACIMQDRLGLKTSCGAFDLNLGCSGFVYGIAVAKGLIETCLVENVLFITADTYTKFINPQDHSARTIFSDGAAATLIVAVDTEEELIGPFVFGTDGKGADMLMVPAGGLRLPISPATAIEKDDGKGIFRSAQNLFMDGPEIFNFSFKTVPLVLRQLLEKCGMKIDEVDYFVFHQANQHMLEWLRKKTKIPTEKFCINMETYGNTVSASIPMALELAQARGKINKGDKILLLGFGVGYSWAGAMVKFI
ncbi:MAG: ketoacyl-ACP synthase III [Deltaproteobacteria bacterium]|nr:ketoacyl-ACP synthase III [Deltaproteobacteria bacterium]